MEPNVPKPSLNKDYNEYVALLKKFGDFEDETRSVFYSTGESEFDDFREETLPLESCPDSPGDSNYAECGSLDKINESFLSMSIIDGSECGE